MRALVSFIDGPTGQTVFANPDSVIVLIPDGKMVRIILRDGTEILTTKKMDDVVKLINENAGK